MTLPKKQTRTMVVDGRTYLRHFKYPEGGWMAIQERELGGQLLLVYLFPSLSVGFASRAIKFALASGWKPGTSEAPLRVGCGNDFKFQVLPHLDPKDVSSYLKLPSYRMVRTSKHGLVAEEIGTSEA